MKTIRLNIFTIILLFPIASFPQENVFEWETDMCKCRGEYDPEIVTINEINNTFNYLFWGPRLNTRSTIWPIVKIPNWPLRNNPVFNVQKLENEFSELSQILDTLSVPKQQFWTELKNDYKNEISALYKLKKQTLLGYDNPQELKKHEIGYSLCADAADALINGGEELMTLWFRLIKEKMIININPDKLHSKYLERAASPDSLDYARLEVMSFGWWNCANRTIPYVPRGGETWKRFKALFVKADCDC